MSRPKENSAGFGLKSRSFWILNVLLVVACAASAVGLHVVSATLDTGAARRFQGESELRFAQLACFLPVGQGKTPEDIHTFRQGLDAVFTEQALEAPETGSLYVDAYSGSGAVSLATDHGSAAVTAIGVGGDFFYFHPLQLRSGAYISERDLMDDLVLLDEELAWRLFGGTELTGLTLHINGEPFVVSGVVRLEEDFASRRARTQKGGIFMSWSALKRLNEELTVDCYEIVMPDPITGYARGVLEERFPTEDGEVVENSGRYTLTHLMEVTGSFGQRSMRLNGIVYPYWENALRLTEDYAALLLILAVLFGLCPLISAVVLAVRCVRWGWRYVKAVVPGAVEDAVERRKERRLEQEMEKQSEGE